MTETPQQAALRLAAKPLARRFRFEGLHEYQNEDGTVAGWRIRLKNDVGEKWIRPMHLNGHGYELGDPPAPAAGRPLYRLPDLLADPAATVWIVEGEKCADVLAGLGIVATTSGSASSAAGADWVPLQGRTVVIWPDNDAPGRKYAEDVAGRLHALGCVVSVVDVPALELLDGGDCADWLTAETSAADLMALQRSEWSLSNERGTSGAGGTGGTGGTAHESKAGGAPPDKHGGGARGAAAAPGVEIIGKMKAKDGTPLPYFAYVERSMGDYARTGVWYVGQAVAEGGKRGVGHLPPQWLCSLLRVVASTRNGQQSEWGRLLAFTDLDGHVHLWAMPFELLAGDGDQLRATLLREGLRITANRRLRPQLETYVQLANPHLRARCVARTGWQGDVFVLPQETFGDDPGAPVLLQNPGSVDIGLSTSGCLEDWVENVARPCAGNSRLVLAISMAFAAPCLGLVHAEGGGAHLRGPSSSGKSTALQVGASVYGTPEAYTQTWRATDNGLEGAASLHSDLLLVLDELGQLEPKHAGQVAYLLANGQGKARSRRDGSLRPVSTWRVLFLSAGEVGLSDLVTQGGGRVQAGQEVRVIDLPADAGAGHGLFERVPEGLTASVFADRLKAAAARHYGTALPALLRAITGDPGKHRETLQALRAEIVLKLVAEDSAGQVRRVADRFALIAAAGELATVLGLTGWATGEAEHAAVVCFRAWLQARGTPGNAEPVAMLAQVRAFLEANGEARFTRWDASGDAPRTVNRAGYRRDGEHGPIYYIEREAFRKEICKGFDPEAVKKVLLEVGALRSDSKGKRTRKERLPDGRSTRVYVVTPALWGDGDERG